MTLKYGVSPQSGIGFANLGLLTSVLFGNYKVASYFAEVGVLLQKSVPSKYCEADALATSYQLPLPWTRSFSSCLGPTMRGCQIGMQAGNLNAAMWCLLMNSVMYPFIMGKPLGGILENCSKITHQIQDLQQKDQALISNLFWQMILNLTSRSRETTKLRGIAFNEDKFQAMTPLEEAYLNAVRLQLLIFFGDYKEAGNLALQKRSLSTIAPAYFFGMLDTFFRGIALYALAQRTKKRKHIEPADEIQSTIEKWAKDGNPNTQHYHLFLCAEQAVYKQKAAEAISLFRKAIVLATRTGHLHHAALFNDRCAAYLRRQVDALKSSQSRDDIEFRSNETIRLYTAWGATAKVKLL